MTPEEKQTALLGGLITMFQTAALQQMGKIKNPVSDKIERDLEQAQMSIDMLDMIQAKTKGNLSSEESAFLANVVRELKLNYVDELGKEQSEKKETR
ncbi:MAG: DUF1844 domain-containing protein [Ignavibacteriales bacterium]|nr:DUF1844 domain-containing protein [Ignavibacteriales bacterium]